MPLNRISRSDLARALHGAIVVCERGCDPLGLLLQARDALFRAQLEGLAPVPEEVFSEDYFDLEGRERVLRAGVAHVWRTCPCMACRWDRHEVEKARERRKRSKMPG